MKKAEGKPEYDTKKSEWEEEKAKMVTQPNSFIFDKCKSSMSAWVKNFPKNNIRDADLIFVPVFLERHFTVLVVNILDGRIEDIDNRSDNKSFARYHHEKHDMVSDF